MINSSIRLYFNGLISIIITYIFIGLLFIRNKANKIKFLLLDYKSIKKQEKSNCNIGQK